MSLSPQRKAKCLEIIDSLLRHKISTIFAYPINLEYDYCPNYFKKIKKPMDLLTVQNKLLNNRYNKFSEFCADVDLIWSNAREYNGQDSIITVLAEQMKMWFHQLIFLMSDDEVADWVTQLHDLQSQVSAFSIQTDLESVNSGHHSDSDSKYENSGEEKDNSDADIEFDEDSFETTPLPNKHETNSTDNAFEPNMIKTTNNIPSTTNQTTKSPKIKNSNLIKNSDESGDDQFSIQSKQNKSSQDKDQKAISADELIELHHIITQLDDADKLLKILNIIRKNEPNLTVNERSVIDMNDLSMTTRVKIYNLIQKMNE